MSERRLLFVDAYDSFSNNIVSLIEVQLGAEVEKLFTDDSRYLHQKEAFLLYLQEFDAVVAGPGPGNPSNDEDVGLIRYLWQQDPIRAVPVLGICLGFQSFALAFGASLHRLRTPRHGVVAHIDHRGFSIFASSGLISATQYNSLHVVFGGDDTELYDNSHLENIWECRGSLEPLAWTTDDSHNGPICMALQHRSLPFVGVQFHPESVCTNDQGAALFTGWYKRVQQWNISNRSPAARTFSKSVQSPILSEAGIGPNQVREGDLTSSTLLRSLSESVCWRSTPLQDKSVHSIHAAMAGYEGHRIILESGTRTNGTPVNRETGDISIIACIDDQDESLEYYASEKVFSVQQGRRQLCTKQIKSNLWSEIKEIMASRKVQAGPLGSPFWGGFIGFASYEVCLESLNIPPDQDRLHRPDAIFVFVSRSLVVDHIKGIIYVQSIRQDDEKWMHATVSSLSQKFENRDHSGKITSIDKGEGLSFRQLERRLSRSDSAVSLAASKESKISYAPHKIDYGTKVAACHEQIRAGNSYELCLTDRTLIKSDPSQDDWAIYQELQRVNPAPFSAYLKLFTRDQSVSILSSSPERFMRWTRDGLCQFRPIKGTVKKEPGVTRKDAEEILYSSKEQAENLMIVDLIRHDLHGIVGSGNVETKKLMSIEEYETVYQLVSVIEGQLPSGSQEKGIDVLSSSLPPGSMTGAPKKRSCQILQDIERHKPRGIYAGVIGYLDVGGGGDFSVVIRTAVKWNSEGNNAEEPANLSSDSLPDSVWSIGAGGAITVQSTIEGEFNEMEAKRAALLKVFLDA